MSCEPKTRKGRIAWLEKHGWTITHEWPSGRINLQWDGDNFRCANEKTAYETVKKFLGAAC